MRFSQQNGSHFMAKFNFTISQREHFQLRTSPASVSKQPQRITQETTPGQHGNSPSIRHGYGSERPSAAAGPISKAGPREISRALDPCLSPGTGISIPCLLFTALLCQQSRNQREMGGQRLKA